MHLVEDLGREEPPVKLSTAHAQRILQILPRPSPEPINRNGKSCNPNYAHGTILSDRD
jgi:hypothetical protein